MSSRAELEILVPAGVSATPPARLRGRVSAFISSWLILILPDFSIWLAQVRHVQSENLLLLALQQHVPNLVSLGGEVRFRRRLHLVHSKHHSIAPLWIGPLISPGFMLNATAGLAGHRPDIRNLAIGQHEIARLHRGAQLLRCLLQIMLRLRAIGKFLRLLRQQNARRVRS